MKNPLERIKLSIHPRDFVRLKSAGKTVDDMTAGQKLVSQAKNYGRIAGRDARGMLRSQRLRKNVGSKNIGRKIRQQASTVISAAGQPFDLKAKQGGSGWTKGTTVTTKTSAANARKFLDHLANRQSQWQAHGSRSRRDTAMRVGAAALGTAGAIYGVKTYRKYRNKAREKTKYRGYDVTKTAHGHVATGKQVYNQPYYNEVEPRHVYDY